MARAPLPEWVATTVHGVVSRLDQAVNAGDRGEVARLLGLLDGDIQLTPFLRDAVEQGHTALVGDLLAYPRALNDRGDSGLITAACVHGDRAMVQQVANFQGNPANLAWAVAQARRDDLVDLVDPAAFTPHTRDQQLAMATLAGHRALVKHLLPTANANAGHGIALRRAALHQHWAIVADLVPVTDLAVVYARLSAEARIADAGHWAALDGIGVCAPAAIQDQWLAAVGEHLPWTRRRRTAQARQSTLDAAPNPAARPRVRP